MVLNALLDVQFAELSRICVARLHELLHLLRCRFVRLVHSLVHYFNHFLLLKALLGFIEICQRITHLRQGCSKLSCIVFLATAILRGVVLSEFVRLIF